MSIRRDQVNLTVTINGNEGKKRLTELESQAAKLKAEMRSLKKGTDEYVEAGVKLNKVRNEADKLRSSIDINKLSIKQLRKEARRLRSIRDDLEPGTTGFNQMDEKLRAVNKRLSELRRGAKDVNPVLDGIKKALPPIGIAAVAAFATDKIIGFTRQTFQLGQELQGIKAGFDRLNDPALLGQLRTAVRGTENDLKLMQLAVQADNFGIPMDVLAQGLEFAQKRATQTGESIEHLTQSFVTGLGRKSTQILDNLGISQVALREEIEKTGDFNTAVTAIMTRELAEMGDVALGTGGKVAQMTASLEKLQAKVATGLNTALEETIDFFTQVADDAVGPVREEFSVLGNDLQQLRDELMKLLQSTGLVGDGFNTIKLVSDLLQGAIRRQVAVWKLVVDYMTGYLRLINGIVDGVRNATNAVTDFLGITSKQAREQKAIQKQREENAALNARLAKEASEKLRKNLTGDTAAVEDHVNKVTELEGIRNAALQVFQEGSIGKLEKELRELEGLLKTVEVGSEEYLNILSQIAEAEEKLGNAQDAAEDAEFKFQVDENGLAEILEDIQTVQTIVIDVLKSIPEIGEENHAQLERAAEKAKKSSEDIKNAVTADNAEIVTSLEEGMQGLFSGLSGLGGALNSVFSQVSEDSQQFASLQKALALFDIFINQARAIGAAVAGATTAAAATGPGAPLVLAGYIASMVATVAAGIGQAIGIVQKQQVPQKFAGGFHDVVGAEDNRNYRAQYRPDLRGGMVQSPSLVLGAEKGPEYWVPNWMLRIPEVMNMTHMLESIRVGRQFASGGFDTGPAPAPPATASENAAPTPELAMLNAILLKLNSTLDGGISARYSNREVNRVRRVAGEMEKVEARARI